MTKYVNKANGVLKHKLSFYSLINIKSNFASYITKTFNSILYQRMDQVKDKLQLETTTESVLRKGCCYILEIIMTIEIDL
jgi:hypothetical protein